LRAFEIARLSNRQEMTLNGSERTGRRWFLRLQSAFVLLLARGIYLLVQP
jgi:hypothetical protein